MTEKSGTWLVALLALVCSLATLARQPLTFEERVKAQEAIERVYYNHRIWPKENPGPKPPFEQMVSRAMLEAKVTDYLKKSAALDEFWQRPISAEQLQAEMDRMAKGTKDPATLKELFATLNNDPYLTAECLARPILADRLVRNWYANDERFHGKTKAKAEDALASAGGGSLSFCSEGNYQKVAYVLSDGEENAFALDGMRHGEIALDKKRFEKQLAETPEEGKSAVLRETSDAFLLIRTVLQTPARIEIGTLVFSKKDLGEWLRTVEPCNAVEEASPVGFAYAVPPMPDASCTPEAWTPASMGANCPSARYYHTAVWTGTEMIVWGGLPSANTGGQYNPSTDSWTPTSTATNCPSARYWHTAVWTGTVMIVWGGYDSTASLLNTGGRYTPSSDSWQTTSTTSCPSGRKHHTAVWTGTKMIVWGGDDTSAQLVNTGGQYNPSSNSWTATSTGASCPSAREIHTAVWTGTEMIVWGGRGSNYVNTGGRYNPSSGTWTPTSTGTGCPDARYYHTAIWTGTEMIVWGGHDNSYNFLNTGGRYTPSTDAWVATSTGVNCPTARDSHTAIWTGTEMIVWGGNCGSSSSFNTGGRYNSSGDSWMPTSTGTNCPSARYHHAACWAGTRMLVWGGYDYYNSLNTGGQYFTGTGMPYEVPNTSLAWSGAGNNTLSWSAADCATAYRVYRGNPSDLVNLPTGATACRAYDGTSTTTGAALSSNPTTGSFFWYLAVGYNANGEGPAGSGTNYPLRMIVNTGTCP